MKTKQSGESRSGGSTPLGSPTRTELSLSLSKKLGNSLSPSESKALMRLPRRLLTLLSQQSTAGQVDKSETSKPLSTERWPGIERELGLFEAMGQQTTSKKEELHGHPMFHQFCDQMKSLHSRKNFDY